MDGTSWRFINQKYIGAYNLWCDRQRLSQIVLVISSSLVTRWVADVWFSHVNGQQQKATI